MYRRTWRDRVRCRQTESFCCHLRTHIATACGGSMGAARAAWGGGGFPFATAYFASIRRVACPWAPPDPAPILQSKANQPVATTVGGRHWLGGVLVSLEFLVLHLLGRKSWGGCHLRQECVPVKSGYDPIND